jgi:pimeloyl-ACP methyl ester carboxylesterase
VEAFLGRSWSDLDGRGRTDVDPLHQVPLDVPVWCVHGGADADVPISQSEAYVAAATDAGARAELVRVQGDHFVVIDVTSDAWSRIVGILDGL